MFHAEYYRQKEKQEALIARKNTPSDFYNGVYTRWTDPVLTRDHAPIHWRYDLNPETNPFFMERLGINAAFNAGAIELDGRFYLVARVEGMDRKSFFAVAESDSGVDGFRFWDHPILLPDTCPEYVFNTPADALRSVDCVKQRCELIDRNLELLAREREKC